MAISSSATGLRPGVCTSTTRPTAPYNGQLIYETDTRKVYIYNGTSWVEQPTAGMVDAKGDLLVGSAADTVARLAVGSDGHALVADSAATNGLSYSPLNGWRNAIINGDFSVNQRGLNSSGQVGGVALTTAQYGQDRWMVEFGGGTVTYSAQAFTVGNPITGQEPANFAQVAVSGQSAAGDNAILEQRIEDVRTFAGQQVTISFWAKATSGTPKVAIDFAQYFGTGGSPSALVTNYVGQVTLSTSWTRHQATFTVPSISGKTLGTNNNHCGIFYLWCSAGSTYNSRTGSLGIQNSTFQFWGVQVEAGSVATPFERRPQQVELALCQRYYYRINGMANTYTLVANGGVCSAGAVSRLGIFLPVSMRTTTITANDMSYNALLIWDGTNLPSVSAIGGMWNTLQTASIDMSVSSAILTAGRPGQALLNGAGFFAINLEL